MAPAVSIIVPVLDEAEGIRLALHALAPLRQAGAEVLVVDGGSADGTATAARDAGADQVIVALRGRATQMNAGAAAARGAVLVFLHADTLLPAGALEAMASAFRGSAGGARPAAVWGRFDVEITGRPALLKLVAPMMNLRSRLSGIATGDQAMFVTRAAFDRVGGFPAQPLMEDIELSRRLRRLGAPACLRLRVRTSGRRWESRGPWRTVWLMWRLRLLYALGVPAERLARSYR